MYYTVIKGVGPYIYNPNSPTMPSSIIRRLAIDMLATTAALAPSDFESYEMDKYLAEFKLRWECGMQLLAHAAEEHVQDTEDDYDDDDDYDEETDEETGEETDEETDDETDEDYETGDESDDDMPGLLSGSDDESVGSTGEHLDYETDEESVCGQF